MLNQNKDHYFTRLGAKWFWQEKVSKEWVSTFKSNKKQSNFPPTVYKVQFQLGLFAYTSAGSLFKMDWNIFWSIICSWFLNISEIYKL